MFVFLKDRHSVNKVIIKTKMEQRSNLDDASNAFIRAYIDEVSRIKKRGTRKQKVAYLIARMKNKESISKQVNNMITERIK